MSADDYFMVRKTPGGKYVALRGFYSDPAELVVEEGREYLAFDDAMEAYRWAEDQGPECGVAIHPECDVRKISKSDGS